nr:hypothetical protein [Desulfobacterales bacterium]
MKRRWWRGVVFLAAAGAVTVIVALEFLAMRVPLPIIPGSGVGEIRPLSHYFERLRGSRGDTEVYFLNGPAPGGTALVLG